MQALPDCSIAEEAQEEEEAEEQEEEQGLPSPVKGLFGRTQALKAQPQQPEVNAISEPDSSLPCKQTASCMCI